MTDGACQLVVERVQLSVTGDDSLSATIRELQSLGFNCNDRRYLLWVDASSPVSLSVPVDAGPYTLVVSDIRNSSFALEVTHPAP